MSNETPIDVAEVKARWWLDYEPSGRCLQKFFWLDNRSELVFKGWLDPFLNTPGQFAFYMGPDEFNAITVLWDANNKETEGVIFQGNLSEWIDEVCRDLEFECAEPDGNLETAGRLVTQALEWADHLDAAAQKLCAVARAASAHIKARIEK